jgi:hypothetical protein
MKTTLIDSLGMKKFSLRWVSQTFTIEQKREKVADSRTLLKVLRPDTVNEFANTITVDESWNSSSDDHPFQ